MQGFGETVLEIGPGIGNLTELLLQRAGRVIAVEKDRQFCECLQALQARYGNLEVVWGDALEWAFPSFDKAVANLPYGSALPLIFKLLDRRFERAVLVCQKRLAERICAGVGERRYGRLSVALGRRAAAERLEVVPPAAFYPPPEVDGAVVLLRRTRPKFSVPDEAFFRLLLETLFAQRQEPVGRAARAMCGRRLSEQALARGLSGVERKVRSKPVFAVTPAEFGKIAWALWKESR
jgi:16S rRNA (adenine1518-N6/adenine1519-N6)-dimethyltransferase